MGGSQVNSAQLESGVISLLCHMIVSARGLVGEPKIYGPLRLMEATQHLIDLAEGWGIRHELLMEVAKRIEEYNLDYCLPGSNEEGFIRFMDDLVTLLATWVRQS